MDEMLDAPHSAKKVKKSTPVTDNNSPVKSETRQKRVLQNGTGNSSDDSPKKEQNYNPKVVITKISKTAKTEQSRGPSKSPNKQESDIEETAQCESPSALEPNDFIGFDDCSSVKPDIFQKLLQNLDNSLESDERNQEEDNELREDKTCEEMTVNDDTGHLSESESSGNSDQMEIDMGNDKEMIIDDPLAIIEKGDTKEDSDVEIMESDSVRSDSENNANNQDENTLNDEPSKLGPPGKGGQQKIEYCGSCSAVVDDAEEGICCDGNCERWFHLRCSGLSQAEYDELSRDENAKWACHKCTGKPQPPKAEGKPLLSVRKDLGNISTPSPTNKRRSVANRDGTPRTPRIDVSNPAFLKPFDFGWKRELVYRSTSDSFNRRQGDIYYYTPKGKKLRSLREISEHLAGTDLTQDNFTFWKEPLGTDDPNKEIIREAKLKTGSKEPAITPRKAIPKITKTPKTVPKLTATVSPMETTATPVVAITPKASASVTPRVVFKGKTSLGPKFKITPSKNSVPGQTPKIVINKGIKTSKSSRNVSNREAPNTQRRYEEVIADPRGDKTVRQSRSSSNKETKNNRVNFQDVIADPREPAQKNISGHLDGEDMNRRNKFRRYGLLANAKTPRKQTQKYKIYTSSSSSGEDTNDSSCERGLKAGTSVEAPMNSNNSMTKKNTSPNIDHNFSEDMQPTYHNSIGNNMFPMENSVEDNLLQQYSNSSDIRNSTSYGKSLLGPNRTRPMPPELQFRPSNPSSYGCQTRPELSSRSTGLHLTSSSSSMYSNSNVINCSSQIETVLIVEPSKDKFRKSVQNLGSGIPIGSPLILSNNGSIEIINVESLNSQEDQVHTVESYTPSDSTRTAYMNKSPSRKFQKTNRYKYNCRKTTEHSPVSVASSSSVEVIVVDEGPDSSNPPPFLDRNSPALRLARNDSTASRSPPSLLPVTSGICYSSQSSQDLESAVYTDNSLSDTITQSVNSAQDNTEQHTTLTGTNHMGYRKMKEKRLRRKISLEKQRQLKIQYDLEKKQLSVKYLQLKIEVKKRQLSVLNRERSRRKLTKLFPL